MTSLVGNKSSIGALLGWNISEIQERDLIWRNDKCGMEILDIKMLWAEQV